MKWKLGMVGVWLGCLAPVMAGPGEATNSVAGRVGVYDSRAVAYAWFWSSAEQSALKVRTDAARAAKESGDTVKYEQYAAALRAQQDQMDREVFSTAPAVEALAVIRGRWAELSPAIGLTNLISKWDAPTLAKYPATNRVEVTDELVHAFLQPSAQQAKVIAGLKKSQPLPLDKCEELIRNGKL